LKRRHSCCSNGKKKKGGGWTQFIKTGEKKGKGDGGLKGDSPKSYHKRAINAPIGEESEQIKLSTCKRKSDAADLLSSLGGPGIIEK